MKLHLPTSLRGALLACMGFACAVSFAQAQEASTQSTTYTAYMSTSAQSITQTDGTTYAIPAGLYAQDANGTKKKLADVATGDLIIFNDLTGDSIYMPLSATTISANVQIGAAMNAADGAANSGLVLTNGTGTKSAATFTFNGSVSGKGNLEFNSSLDNQKYIFNGDLADYRGSILFNHATNSGVADSVGHEFVFNNNSETQKTLNAASVKVNGSVTFAGTGTGGYQVNSEVSASTLVISSNNVEFSKAVDTNGINVDSGKSVSLAVTNGEELSKGAAGTLTLQNSSNVGTLTVNNGTVNVQSGATISSAEVRQGALVLSTGSQTSVGDITIRTNTNNGGGLKTSADGTATLSSTVTLKAQNTDSAVTWATLKAKDGTDWSAKGLMVDRFSGTYGVIGQAGYSDTAAAEVSNVDLNITGAVYFKDITFTNSRVTVESTGSIISFGSGYDASFDELVVKGGGSLTSASNTYNGLTSLTLSTLGGSGTEFTTGVLPGTLAGTATLTLSFDDEALAAISAINGGSFSLTLTGLTANDATTYATTLENWTVSLPAASAISTGSGLTLTFTKAVPEPTTATLSLLALAGLAMRRRRK